MLADKQASVADYISKLQNVLIEAKNEFSSDQEIFLKIKIFKMGRFIRFYSELMTFLGTKLDEDTVEEMENFDNNLADQLKLLKLDWDEFVLSIEKKNNETMLEEPNKGQKSLVFESNYYKSIHRNNKETGYTSLTDLHQTFRKSQSSIEKKDSYMHLVMLRHFA